MKVIKNTIMAGLALLTGFAFAENTSAYTESLMIFADSTASQENTLQFKTESESTSQANAPQENTLQNELAPEQKPSPEQET